MLKAPRKRTEVPIYSFAKHAREEETSVIYSPHVLILEGIFALHDPRILELLDLKVSLSLSPNIIHRSIPSVGEQTVIVVYKNRKTSVYLIWSRRKHRIWICLKTPMFPSSPVDGCFIFIRGHQILILFPQVFAEADADLCLSRRCKKLASTPDQFQAK